MLKSKQTFNHDYEMWEIDNENYLTLSVQDWVHNCASWSRHVNDRIILKKILLTQEEVIEIEKMVRGYGPGYVHSEIWDRYIDMDRKNERDIYFYEIVDGLLSARDYIADNLSSTESIKNYTHEIFDVKLENYEANKIFKNCIKRLKENDYDENEIEELLINYKKEN